MAFFRNLGPRLFCAIGALAAPLIAQKVVSARAGLITYLQGPAFVNGQRVFLKTARFPQMRNGETLSLGRGRAELLLAPGVVLRLAENSQVRMEETLLSDTRVTIQHGDALIEIVRLADGSRIQVDLSATTTELTRPGLYRFGIAQNGAPDGTAQNTLRVYGGEALVRLGTKTADAKRGMSVELGSDLAMSRFDRKEMDSLHAWAARRSFDLFMGDPEARDKQTHWQPSGGGYVENKNFGVEFRAFIRRGPAPVPPPIGRAETQ